jgi:UDP-glucose 4-epimerase
VADLAEAHLLAIGATTPGDARTTEPLVCNLGNGDGFSVREVLSTAETVTGRSIPVTIGARAPAIRPCSSRVHPRRGGPGLAPASAGPGRDGTSAWAWRQAHPHGYEG